MKILITGAAGFIGSNAVRFLSKNKSNTLLGIDSPFNLLVALCSASFLLSKSELGEVFGLVNVLLLGTKGVLPLGLSFDVFGLE